MSANLETCHSRVSIAQKSSSDFWLQCFIGNPAIKKISLILSNWIPDEAFHEKLKEFSGKANSGMTSFEMGAR